MQLDDNDLLEYRRIWREEFGEEISLDDARHSASMLMELYALLIQPIPKAPSRSSESSLPDHRT